MAREAKYIIKRRRAVHFTARRRLGIRGDRAPTFTKWTTIAKADSLAEAINEVGLYQVHETTDARIQYAIYYRGKKVRTIT